MKLLVSPMDEQEALEAVAGGADIIDVKNPKEGPLGASFPWTIRRIRQVTPQQLEVSCTLGDLPNLPGSASLAALGAASTGVNYVKVSLYHLKTADQAVTFMQSIVKAVKDYNPEVKVVVAGYADASRVGSVEPLSVPRIARDAGCDLAMLDTAVKDGKTLLDFLRAGELKGFVDEAHRYGLQSALAGNLKIGQLPVLCGLGVDIVGVRGATCAGGNRVTGHITKEKVKAIVQVIQNALMPCRAAGT
ncbi:MAG: hypothetical protein NWF00_12590 [Candidatus Bathyarchaeota archaeon]|nr:hypothetical protein [Candidatus Bathyarchaeota archaeon]